MQEMPWNILLAKNQLVLAGTQRGDVQTLANLSSLSPYREVGVTFFSSYREESRLSDISHELYKDLNPGP